MVNRTRSGTSDFSDTSEIDTTLVPQGPKKQRQSRVIDKLNENKFHSFY